MYGTFSKSQVSYKFYYASYDLLSYKLNLNSFDSYLNNIIIVYFDGCRYYNSEWLGEENNRKAPHQDLEITRERKNCILKYFPNQDERREVNIEYSNFSLSLEDFGSVDAIHDRFILEPLRWWAVHGSSAPKLQALAFKLLGQPSSSSCCERNWSTYKFIHSATRNKIMPQRAEDLVFVHTNLRLLSRRSSAYKEGPNKMWDVGCDQFDYLDDLNIGRLVFEDPSL